MKQSFKQRFEDELKKLSDGLSKTKGRKKFTKIIERIGRLKEKHKRISGCYEVNALASEDGLTAIAIEWKVIEEKMNDKLTGSYLLRTNLVDMEAKELWQLYNTLRGIEDAFRHLRNHVQSLLTKHEKPRVFRLQKLGLSKNVFDHKGFLLIPPIHVSEKVTQEKKVVF